MKYGFIKAHRAQHKVVRLCEVLGVSTSGYYDWLDRPESNCAQSAHRLTAEIIRFHQASHKRYGSPRIFKDLREAGERCSVNRVARLMRKNGIQSKMARKFVVTTNSKHTQSPAADLLKRNFDVPRANHAWVCDTTFIGTREGWLYLAIVLDLYSRQVIGWSMGKRNNAQLVIDALTMALWRRGKVKGVIVHSDQGSTYASTEHRQLLKDNRLFCSMSRKGECLDNAVAESFFGSLKTELTDNEDYLTRTAARNSLFEYIEVFYNRRRRHSYLDYMAPAEYEEKYASNF